MPQGTLAGRTDLGAGCRPPASARDILARARDLLDDPTPARSDLVVALFQRESTVPSDVVNALVARDEQRVLLELGLVQPAGDDWAALARIDRAGDLLIASDLRRHCRQRDFVVGPGPASHLLARHLRPVAGGQALDLGSGSGIQSLLLARAGMVVTALDINPRALAFARFNAALNGLSGITAVAGDFLTDDADASLDGRFDVVVANPPFVLSPHPRLTYRDRPLPGDTVGSRTVERTARALAPGGRGHVLCNWIGDGAHDWSGPVRCWTATLPVDVAVMRVADDSAATYARRWTTDVPATDREAATAAWVAALEAEGVRRVQVGVIALSRCTTEEPSARRFEAVDLV